MIINKNRNPEYSLYFIGAKILEILKESKQKSIFDLFSQINDNVYNQKLTIDYLYYSLDWLYLLGKVQLEKENVILCN